MVRLPLIQGPCISATSKFSSRSQSISKSKYLGLFQHDLLVYRVRRSPSNVFVLFNSSLAASAVCRSSTAFAGAEDFFLCIPDSELHFKKRLAVRLGFLLLDRPRIEMECYNVKPTGHLGEIEARSSMTVSDSLDSMLVDPSGASCCYTLQQSHGI